MTAQEELWRGQFGDDYTRRSPGSVEDNVHFFIKTIGNLTHKIDSVIEFGAGVGNNLRAIRQLDNAGLYKGIRLDAVEINQVAFEQLPEFVTAGYLGSMFEAAPLPIQYDLVLTKGLLIHIAPEDIDRAYEVLYRTSRRYILLAEYYNPTLVCIRYRGQEQALWKRDFAGEMLDRFPDLRLLDYGFVYHRDRHPQDDLTWFLMEKP